MKPIIEPKLFSVLSFSFIFFTIIGTLSHEMGHYTIAKLKGFKGSTINYASSNPGTSEEDEILDSIYSIYKTQIDANTPFPAKNLWNTTIQKYSRNHLWITLGGPLQTMLTGTIGFILLLLSGSKTPADSLSFKQWSFVFLSLFWLRQTTNFVVGLGVLLASGKHATTGDEIRLADQLGIPIYSIQTPTALIGIGILVYIVFKVIPQQQRITFLAAGAFGGVTGYLFWLQSFGKIIMP